MVTRRPPRGTRATTPWSTAGPLAAAHQQHELLGHLRLGRIAGPSGHQRRLGHCDRSALITPLVFVLGESLPKEIFRRHADRLVYTLSAPLPILRWAATIVLLLPFVQTMQAWPAASQESGLVELKMHAVALLASLRKRTTGGHW